MPDVENITIKHAVFLAFKPMFARAFDGYFAAQLDQVLIAKNLGADESPLQIAMNHTGSLRRCSTGWEAPGARTSSEPTVKKD